MRNRARTRALTPDELRKRIPKWSLESDGQLLQYMNQIAKNLEEKCKQTQSNLNQLLLEIDESHIRYANASNSFNGIQQLQYVENRVQDDDESFYSVREEEEEKGEKLPYGEIFHMAVESSIANMYKSFEKVTVQLDSDSESDDDDEEATARNTVLRAIQKYPYISRPLPHIIGSQEWREKWHAGLIDSEEETDTEPKEQYSDSSDSEGMFPSKTNSNHTPSESEGSVWGVHSDPRRRAPSYDPSMSGDDALSIHSSSSAIKPAGARSLLNHVHHKVPVLPGFRPPSLFPDQPPTDDIISVSSRNKVANLFEDSEEEDSTPTHRPATVNTTNSQQTYFRGNQQERKTVNLFDDEPPPSSSHEPTPTSSISGHSQKKPINLFVESDEDDSFNNNNSMYQNERLEPTNSTLKKSANLFDDNDSTPKTNRLIADKSNTGSFDRVNNNEFLEEDDDLFVPVKRSINGGVGKEQKDVRRAINLFDDEPPEDDFDQIFKPKLSENKIPGAKLVLPPMPVIAKVNDTDKLENDERYLKKSEKNVLQRKVEPVTTATQPVKKVNLFDDDEDDNADDIFDVTKKEFPENAMPSKPKINLFDDDDDDDDYNVKPSIDRTKVLADQVKNNVAEQVHSKDSTPSQNSSIRKEILMKKSIFESDSNEDEEDDILFGGKSTISNIVTKKEPKPLPRKVEPTEIAEKLPQNPINDILPSVKSEIADSEENESESQISQPKTKQTSIRSEILKKKSIFDSDTNEDEDDDSLFGRKPPASAVVAKEEVQTPSKSIPNVKPTDTAVYINDRVKIEEIVKLPEKPKIPDEPPEDDEWKDHPPDDVEPNYPDVSNDIDYYLTTNRINGLSESTKSTSLVQTNMEPRQKTANLETNVVASLSEDNNSKSVTIQLAPDEGKLQNPEQHVNVDHSNIEVLQPDSKMADPDRNDSSDHKSALQFNSIGLFDDIPPPDDCFEESRSTMLGVDHTDDGFYSGPPPSGLSNTIPSTSSVSTNQYLFMDSDGPPPDDELDDSKTKPIDDQHSTFKSISAIIEQRNRNESTSYETNREKPKINRLSTKVNINVNALLPGARRTPSLVEKTAEVVDSLDVPNSLSGQSIVSQPESNPQPANPAKLVNLNKGRAKIQTKRKPQSRQIRRSNYENSLLSETGQAADPSEEILKEEVRVVVGSEERTQHVEVVAAHLKVEQMLSNELMQKLSEPKLFDSGTDEEEKLFAGTISNPSNSSISTKSVSNEPKNLKSSVKETLSKPLLEPQQPAPKSSKLFSDGDSSDDSDLFGKISKPIVVQNPTVMKPKPENQLPVVASSSKSSTKIQSIFGDSDEDDDLFGKPKSSAKPLPKSIGSVEPPKVVNVAKKSIFGSEEDSDGDDIFGGSTKRVTNSNKKPAEKEEPKILSSRAKLPISSKRLFGEDDDDDDDLFSSKSKPASKPTSSQQVVRTKKVERNHTTSVKPTVDDPLADLLKQ